MHDCQPDYFARFITSIFERLGVNPPFNETILLRNGFYAGRKFRAGGYQVAWWVDRNVAEVIDQDGQTLETIGLDATLKTAG
jgi:hypothetical protein